MVSTPSPPDPYKVADAQGAANKEAAVASSIVNNMNEYSPYGSVTYTLDGMENIQNGVGTPRYRRTVNLAPAQQKMLDQQNTLGINLNDLAIGQVDRLGNVLNKPVNLDQYKVDLGSTEQARKDAQEAILSRLEPQFERDRQTLDSTLVSRGLVPGSEAYNRQVDEFNRQKTDARFQAVLAGGQEQQNQANLALNQGQYNSQLALAERNQPFNEISALMSGGQVTVPQFSSPYQQGIQPAPVADSVYNSYNAQARNSAAANSGLFGLGSTLLGGLFTLSDRRAKTDIRKIGKTDSGTNVYKYRYRGRPETHIGVMAQEVEKTHPGAVAEFGGVKMVDYSRVD